VERRRTRLEHRPHDGDRLDECASWIALLLGEIRRQTGESVFASIEGGRSLIGDATQPSAIRVVKAAAAPSSTNGSFAPPPSRSPATKSASASERSASEAISPNTEAARPASPTRSRTESTGSSTGPL
jgi:hypothetical protein